MPYSLGLVDNNTRRKWLRTAYGAGWLGHAESGSIDESMLSLESERARKRMLAPPSPKRESDPRLPLTTRYLWLGSIPYL